MGKKQTKEHLVKRAKKLYKRESYEKCIKTCNKILKLYPDFLEAYILKLDAFKRDTIFNLKFSKYSNEIKDTILQYIKNSPKNEENYLTMLHEIPSEDYQFKLKVVDESLKLWSESNDLLMFKLEAFILHHKFGENMDYIDNLSKTNKNWKNVLYVKANYYNDLKEYDKSLKIYNEILEYSKDFETISRKLKTLKKLGKDEDAFEILNKVMDEDKNWALVNKALYYQRNDNEEAMRIIDEVIDDNP
jgi:tetratricopeptide (TPR) repeat protein